MKSKLAFVFPGQGTQYVGMGQAFYEAYPLVREYFNRGSHRLNMDLADLCFNGPASELIKTEHQQPAIHTVEVSILSLLQAEGVVPDVVAGFSLGEYAALVAASAINYDDSVVLVRKRGIFMQNAVPQGIGKMLAISGLSRDIVESLVLRARTCGWIECSNYNCPGQIIVSGEKEAVAMADVLAKRANAKHTTYLNVSGPFHTQMLRDAGHQLAEELTHIALNPPVIPFIPNVSGQFYRSGQDLRRILEDHVYLAVRWEETVETMLKNQVRIFVEIGPTGSVTKFNQRTVEAHQINDAKFFHIETPDQLFAFMDWYKNNRN